MIITTKNKPEMHTCILSLCCGPRPPLPPRPPFPFFLCFTTHTKKRGKNWVGQGDWWGAAPGREQVWNPFFLKKKTTRPILKRLVESVFRCVFLCLVVRRRFNGRLLIQCQWELVHSRLHRSIVRTFSHHSDFEAVESTLHLR